MVETITGPDGRKFCIINKISNNFKTQDDFTKWEQSVKTDDIFIFINQNQVLITYEIKYSEFSDIPIEEKTIEIKQLE